MGDVSARTEVIQIGLAMILFASYSDGSNGNESAIVFGIVKISLENFSFSTKNVFGLLSE